MGVLVPQASLGSDTCHVCSYFTGQNKSDGNSFQVDIESGDVSVYKECSLIMFPGGTEYVCIA